MTDLKLIVTGSKGAGKTTVVTTMSEAPLVRTDAPYGTDQGGNGASGADVTLDRGAMTLDDGRKLQIFGTPGQRRHDFMCKVLAQGAVGVIILLDHAGDDPRGDLIYYMDLFRDTAADTGVVIGVINTDGDPETDLQAYYDVLAQEDRVLPVFSVDARNRTHLMVMLEALVATA